MTIWYPPIIIISTATIPTKAIRYLIINTIKAGRSFTLPPPIGLQIVESVPQVGGVEVGAVDGVVGAAVVDGAAGVAVVASACATLATEKIGDANGVINAHPGKTSREFRSTTQNKASSCK